MDLSDKRILFGQIVWIGLLAVAISSLLVVRFTTRSADEKQRARAHTILRSVHALQQNHYAMYGTYLPSDRANTGEVLKWTSAPGRFRYRVTTGYGTFRARASADLDGNGQPEIWQVDPDHAEPRRVQAD